MIHDPYERGKQPCSCFEPNDDLGPDMGNVHSCPGCQLTRSFCTNCNHDHHENGWDACQARIDSKLPCGHPAACGEPCGWCAEVAEIRKTIRDLLGEPNARGEGWWRAECHEEDCPDASGWLEGYSYAEREADEYAEYARPCRCDGVERERRIEALMQEPRP